MSGKGSPPPTEAAVHRHRPKSVGDEAGAFARAIIERAGNLDPERAKALSYAARKLARFGLSLGLSVEAAVLLCPAVIERFIAQGTSGLSPASVRTLASNLRYLQRVTAGDRSPGRARLPRERAKAPYSDEEIAAFLACAKAQSTEQRRMRATALICLGAGAGVIGSELRHLRGSDVAERSGTLIVAVAGKRARGVPVRWGFHAPLLDAAHFAGDGYILGGTDPERGNLTDAITALFGDEALPRLDSGRLRSTWLAEAARQIGLHAFMAAAGVRCSQRLGDIAASLPTLTEPELVALLEGSP